MTKKKDSAEKAIRDIRRATRRRYSAEEKIRIVLEGLRGESSIAELCRKEGINQNLCYRWSKEFLEAGKKRLAGDTALFLIACGGDGGSVTDTPKVAPPPHHQKPSVKTVPLCLARRMPLRSHRRWFRHLAARHRCHSVSGSLTIDAELGADTLSQVGSVSTIKTVGRPVRDRPHETSACNRQSKSAVR